MKDIELFAWLRDKKDSPVPRTLMTVLSGEHAGEMALFDEDGFAGATGDFFREYVSGSFVPPMPENVRLPGICSINGTQVFAEQITGAGNLVLCGGGNVSQAVVRIAKMTGFHVTVLEDRLYFAECCRRAGSDVCICDAFGKALRELPDRSNTCYVVVTRGHRYDEECLREIAKKKWRYLGMMGSHRRSAMVKETLLREGIPKELVEQLHAPVGLPIGAETPEEIAVSIMAQIISECGGKKRHDSFPEELLVNILEKLAEPENGQERTGEVKTPAFVMAVIVSRKGSTPRQEGTRMLIFRNGECAGTIGGGCAEAEIVSRARMLLADENRKTELMEVRLLAEEAEEEGMVCGGVQEIFLEKF